MLQMLRTHLKSHQQNLQCHTFSVADCRARPYEKVRDHGALGQASCNATTRYGLLAHHSTQPNTLTWQELQVASTVNDVIL